MSSEPAPAQSPLLASLVVGSNGATSLRGNSRELRTPEDRERFLALRNSNRVGAIVVGSATADAEPYQKAPHPLYIYRRSSGLTPKELIEKVRREISGAILCEGGITLIHHLLREDLIDEFHLTHAPIPGDDHYLDRALLTSKLSLSESESKAGTTFEKYERASR